MHDNWRRLLAAAAGRSWPPGAGAGPAWHAGPLAGRRSAAVGCLAHLEDGQAQDGRWGLGGSHGWGSRLQTGGRVPLPPLGKVQSEQMMACGQEGGCTGPYSVSEMALQTGQCQQASAHQPHTRRFAGRAIYSSIIPSSHLCREESQCAAPR